MLRFTIEKKLLLPVLIALSLILTLIGILYLQLLFNEELYFVNRITFGFDFKDFYYASQQLLSGNNPYLVKRFVTPPLSSLVAVPFQVMELQIASRVFSIISLFIFILALSFIIQKQPINKDAKVFLLISILIVVGLSYPIYFLFDRGNIDFLVVSFLIAGIYLIDSKPIMSGLLISLSIILKIYPVMILVPILLKKQYKIFSYVICFIILSLIVMPSISIYYFNEVIYNRMANFRYDENTSIINLMLWIKRLFTEMEINLFANAYDQYFIYFSYLLYAVMIIFMGNLDSKLEKNNDSYYLSYFPLMVMVPNLVFQYELIMLIPLIILVVSFSEQTTKPLQKIAVWGITFGIILTQLQVVALEKLFDVIYPHFLSSFGLFIVTVSIISYKYALVTDKKNI